MSVAGLGGVADEGYSMRMVKYNLGSACGGLRFVHTLRCRAAIHQGGTHHLDSRALGRGQIEQGRCPGRRTEEFS
jgi:hypothetical protein